MLAAAAEEPTIFDNHFRPQADFLFTDTKIFKYEDGLSTALGEVFSYLKQDASDLEFPHKLKSTAAKPYVSPKDVALIEDVFAADYQDFGYATQSVSQSKCLAHIRGKRTARTIARAYRLGQI